MQERQPDTHITLAELTTWFKEVEHLQTGPNADATTTLKSLQSIRQGIEAFGHLLGLEGTKARAQGESHNWKSTPANKVLALDTVHAASTAPPCACCQPREREQETL